MCRELTKPLHLSRPWGFRNVHAGLENANLRMSNDSCSLSNQHLSSVLTSLPKSPSQRLISATVSSARPYSLHYPNAYFLNPFATLPTPLLDSQHQRQELTNVTARLGFEYSLPVPRPLLANSLLRLVFTVALPTIVHHC